MGSFSRLYEKLKSQKLVSEPDLAEVAQALDLLKNAGEELDDIMYMWYEGQEPKEEVIVNARKYIHVLHNAVDRIATAK